MSQIWHSDGIGIFAISGVLQYLEAQSLRACSSHNTICRGLPVSSKLCNPLALQFISNLNVQMVRQEPGTERPQHKAKIVLLGEGRVGKTSLVSRIIHNTFKDSQQATMQAAFTSKTLEVDKQQVEVAFWDTAGQERFHSLAPLYYRDADAALLVYDITDKHTLQQVRSWVKELQAMVGVITLTILGNKCDMAKQQAVPEEESRSYADSIGAQHHYVSAKTGEGISAAVRQTVHRVLEHRSTQAQQQPQSYMPGRRQGGLIIAAPDQEVPSRKQSVCC